MIAKNAPRGAKNGKGYKHTTPPGKIEFERFLKAFKGGCGCRGRVNFGGFWGGIAYA